MYSSSDCPRVIVLSSTLLSGVSLSMIAEIVRSCSDTYSDLESESDLCCVPFSIWNFVSNILGMVNKSSSNSSSGTSATETVPSQETRSTAALTEFSTVPFYSVTTIIKNVSSESIGIS